MLSQAVLSLQLPFAIVPLIEFTSDGTLMGKRVVALRNTVAEPGVDGVVTAGESRMATTSTKSRKRTTPTRNAPQRTPRDAIALLRADHAKVAELFEQFEKARENARKLKLAQTICSELKVHTTIEEEIFYPAARAAIQEDDLLDEAEVEHASAKELIAQIESGSPEDEKWEAKVTVLGEYIRHHVKEEQNEMFPKVRKTDLDLKELGDELAARKAELRSNRQGVLAAPLREIRRLAKRVIPGIEERRGR